MVSMRMTSRAFNRPRSASGKNRNDRELWLPWPMRGIDSCSNSGSNSSKSLLSIAVSIMTKRKKKRNKRKKMMTKKTVLKVRLAECLGTFTMVKPTLKRVSKLIFHGVLSLKT